MITYKIDNGPGGEPFIECLLCGRLSYNRNDIKYRYCGKCHKFHDDIQPSPPRATDKSHLMAHQNRQNEKVSRQNTKESFWKFYWEMFKSNMPLAILIALLTYIIISMFYL